MPRPREKLIKIGAKNMRSTRYITFKLAEVAVPRSLFKTILARVQRFAAVAPKAEISMTPRTVHQRAQAECCGMSVRRDAVIVFGLPGRCDDARLGMSRSIILYKRGRIGLPCQTEDDRLVEYGPAACRAEVK